MRVAFDASVIFSSVGGTKTYALQLMTAMQEVRPDWTFFPYTRDEQQAAELRTTWPSSKVSVGVLAGSPNTWRVQTRFPAALRRDRIDVFHSLGYFLPLRWGGAKVVTIHDMNVYSSWRHWARPGKFINWADMALQIPFAARAASRIVTDSRSSAQSIHEILRVDLRKIAVVPLAPNPYFDESPLASEIEEARDVAGGDPFVLFVGIISPQKNLGMLVRAFAESGLATAGFKLVLAGSDREGEGRSLMQLAIQSGLERHVVLPGFVSEPTLRALYHSALVVVLPSHGEGFGLPLVEAMASGAPVLAARRQSLPEVVGDGGVVFEPNDVSSLAALLRRLHEDVAFRRELVKRARARRKAFSWQAAAEATASVYEDVLRSRR